MMLWSQIDLLNRIVKREQKIMKKKQHNKNKQ